MPDQDRKTRRRLWRAQLLAYVLIVTLGTLGFAQAEQQREESRQRGEEHRQVTASVVCALATLIEDLVTPPADQPTTAEQDAFMTRTLERLDRFRAEQLEQLGYTERC